MRPIKELNAILFDIQRFSVNDGPGIRTNLFFKGCPLRCEWCHNPESFIPGKQLSFQASMCVGCMECVKTCPNQVNEVVEREENKYLNLHYDRCRNCGECMKICCYDARSMIGKSYTVSELLAEIMVDKVYYDIGEERMRGGITLTGGEPMSQFEFIDHFLNAVGDIDVCMETSGYGKTEDFNRLLGRISCFLFDYKVTDSEKHKKLCGVDNTLILKNLKFLCDHGAAVILRLPLIRGVNDDAEHLKTIARLVKENPSIHHAEIMAYHNLGEVKAEQIGYEGGVWKGETATTEQKDWWLSQFHKYGLEKVKIG